MDAISDPECETIVLMTSAQVGKTEVVNNIIGYHIHMDPCPILVLQPSQKPMAEAWSKDRLAPMLRDTPCLRGKVSDPKGRDSGNTILHKSFPGGHLTVAGANSPAGLASRPIRIVLCDEVDRYPASAGSEGDPVSLARKRATTYWNRKIVLTSTPTVKGASRIEAAYEESTQERYFVPCPHCAESQALDWERVTWQDNDPETAAYACGDCGATWTDAERWAALREGEWHASKPGRKTRGFHLSELYSPWVTIEDMVRSYLEAKALPETLKTWVNTALGETYETEGEQEADADSLFSRRESYTVLPKAAVIVCAGVDVQNDRLEVELVAFSRTLESWSIDYRVIHGDPRIPAEQSGSPWADLDQVMAEKHAREDGVALPLWAACVDANFLTDEVCRYVKRRRRVYAVRGQAGMGKPAVATWTRHKRELVKLYTLGVDTLKSRLFSRLAIEAEGPGYCHFPAHYELRYFDQLTAEKAVKKTRPDGRPIVEWQQTQERNEALDCRVYAMSAMELRRPIWGRTPTTTQAAAELTQEASHPLARERPQRGRKRSAGGKNWVTGYRL